MKTDPQGVDNRANQLNPRHPAYHLSRGASPEEAQRLAAEAAAEHGGVAQHPGKPSPK
ncbi:MAG TPA: hypothetical protein VK539_00630 [Myxococcaceae bacterium]|nr:hypothetical protein [Myxococcaceae bacterium]